MVRQSGMTLVELMIAAALGIVLISGISSLSITVNRSVDLSDGISRNQENGRFTMDYLTKYVRRAGYSEDSTKEPLPLYVSGESMRHCSDTNGLVCAMDNQMMSGLESRDISGDRLSIPFHASEETEACSGEMVAAGNTYANVFWVNSTRQLLCRVFNITARTWQSVASVTIINGVESMHYQIGMARNKDDKEAARYLSLSGGEDMNLIRSVRIAILVSSQDPSNTRARTLRPFEKTYGLLDSDPINTDDGFVRHVFSNTIDIPNMIAGASGD